MKTLKRDENVRIGLPKGRMQTGVESLLADAGIVLSASRRSYRPSLNLEGCEVKVLKPQNIVRMLAAGSRDIGFAGADWVEELDADLVELLDTGLNPVQVVAAAPRSLLLDGRLPHGPIVIATEYETLTRKWIASRELDARVVRSYGATEVFPPEDADCIVDNTATGATLDANNLVIIDELMRSSTRLYANHAALLDPVRRARIDDLVLLLRSVLAARERVMVELNVDSDSLKAIVNALPCMREPTVATLAGNGGFSVRVAVPRADISTLIPQIKALGGTDIVVTRPTQIVV